MMNYREDFMSERRVLNGRVATKAESEANKVIFYIPEGRSIPYCFGPELPLTAIVTKSDLENQFPEPGTIVEIVQAELVDGMDVVLGFIDGSDEGICALEDIRLIEPSQMIH